MRECFSKVLLLLEGRIDDDAKFALFIDKYSHFEVLKYFVRSYAPSQTLAFKGSKFLSA